MEAGVFEKDGVQIPKVFLVITNEEAKTIAEVLEKASRTIPKKERNLYKKVNALHVDFQNLPIWG